MNVLIVESPSKAKSINKYLGSDFKVLASVGHVRDLSAKNDAIDTENDFQMKWETSDRGKNVIKEILDNFLRDQKKYSSFQEGLAAMFACKAAIKAGDSLVREEMQELVNRLFSTKHPYYCPHGRPIIVQMSLNELDSRFERH